MDKFLQSITNETQLLVANGRTSEAIYALEQTISWLLAHLGMIWGENFDLKKAEEYLRLATKVNQIDWGIYANLSHFLNTAFKFEEAKEAVLKAIAMDGRCYESYYNLGVILSNLLDHENAVEAYKKASELFTGRGYNVASYNASNSLLALERWKEGWEAYETRFKSFETVKNIHARFKTHYLPGDPAKDKTIYVYSEQGIGDLIQFARYLPKLKSMGAKVILESQDACTVLLANNFKLDGSVSREDGDAWPVVPEDIDYALSICSLPGLFEAGTKGYTEKTYIKAPKREKPDILRNDKFKVGLCYAGNARHLNDYRRSIHLGWFKPLFDVENTQIFSLQKDMAATASRTWNGRQVNLLEQTADLPLTDLSSLLNDFNDLAYFISQMDIVVTVDTAVVHLAGAMGKTTWLLIDKLNDWRWGLSGDQSKWYPSVRIFRQTNFLEWGPLLESVAKELTSYRLQHLDQNESPSCNKKDSLKRIRRKRFP